MIAKCSNRGNLKLGESRILETAFIKQIKCPMLLSLVRIQVSHNWNQLSHNSQDRVFSKADTREIYQQVASDLIVSTLGGVNGTIFAYGQTSSGKTHTMQGSPSFPGIMPLAVQHIFDLIQQVRF